ncbi:MAG: prepilin-type N-terminal cleavage/methylation domain-containing protein [Candidatus Zambryskibacteria bacterium]|nr:prepilin-type N-terminal cleavage/methylation domain-containing protein [Candidatus Zambryskibacteria bacterium]
MKKYKKGFTLVELLVVIAIIGILSSITIANLDEVKGNARDAKRKEDMLAIQTALELYHLDHGSYPFTGACQLPDKDWYGFCNLCPDAFKNTSGLNGYIPDLAPTYISELPVDPSGITVEWSGYLYCSDGFNYKFIIESVADSWPAYGTKFFDYHRYIPATNEIWSWQITSNPAVTNDPIGCQAVPLENCW